MLHVIAWTGLAAKLEYDRTPQLQERAASLTVCSVLSVMQRLPVSLSVTEKATSPSQPLQCQCMNTAVHRVDFSSRGPCRRGPWGVLPKFPWNLPAPRPPRAPVTRRETREQSRQPTSTNPQRP